MPYKSDKQRRFFHAAQQRGEIPKKVVNEFDQASKGKDLPEVVRKYLGGMMHKAEGGEVDDKSFGDKVKDYFAPAPSPYEQIAKGNLSASDLSKGVRGAMGKYSSGGEVTHNKQYSGEYMGPKYFQPNPDMSGQEYDNQYGAPDDVADDQSDPDMGYDLGDRSQEEQPGRLWMGGYSDGGEYEGEEKDEHMAGDQADVHQYSDSEEDEEDMSQSGPTKDEDYRLELVNALRKRKRTF